MQDLLNKLEDKLMVYNTKASPSDEAIYQHSSIHHSLGIKTTPKFMTIIKKDKLDSIID